MAQILTLFRKRLIGSMIVLLIVIIGCFLMLEMAPGDAVDAYAVSFGGDAAAIAEMRARWGLDQSIWHRLGAYLIALVQGNLGWSVSFNRPILDVILERLPNTLLLMGAATALSFALGSALGIVAGAKPGSFRDRFLSVASLVLYAIPGFWLSLVLVILFRSSCAGCRRAGSKPLPLVKRGSARYGHSTPFSAAGCFALARLSGALSPRYACFNG